MIDWSRERTRRGCVAGRRSLGRGCAGRRRWRRGASRRASARARRTRASPRVARLRAENEQLRRQQAYSDERRGVSFNSRTSLSAELRPGARGPARVERAAPRGAAVARADGAGVPGRGRRDAVRRGGATAPGRRGRRRRIPGPRRRPRRPGVARGAGVAVGRRRRGGGRLGARGVPRRRRRPAAGPRAAPDPRGRLPRKVPAHHVATAARRRWFRGARAPGRRRADVVRPRALRRAQQGGGPSRRRRRACASSRWRTRASSGRATRRRRGGARRPRAALPVEDLCWSLVAGDGRTLDLAAETVQEARLWKEALGALLRALDGGRRPRRPRRRRRRRPPCRAVLPLEARRPARAVGSGDAAALGDALRTVADVDGVPRRGDGRHGPAALLPAGLRRRRGDVPAAGARNDPHPTWGGTALQLAVAHGQTAAARALLAAAAASGADRAVANHVVVSEDRGGADLRRGDAPSPHGRARLRRGAAALLLEHHADPLARDAGGRTAAHVAVAAGRDRGLDVLALLLGAGFAGAVDARDGSDRGEAVLHVACRSGAGRCAALLLRSAADARAGRRARRRATSPRARASPTSRTSCSATRARRPRRRRRRRARPRPSPRSGGSARRDRRGRGRDDARQGGYASDSSRGSRDGDWPAAMTRARAAAAAAAAAAARDVPLRRRRVAGALVEADQYAYFQHVATGHTQWDDPRRGRPPPPPAPPPPPPPPQRASRSRSAPEVLGNARRRPARDASPGRRASRRAGRSCRPSTSSPSRARRGRGRGGRPGPVVDARRAGAAWDTVSTLRASPAPDRDERPRRRRAAGGPEPPASTRSNFSARTFESSAASDGEFETSIATDDGGGGGGDPEDEVDEFFEELVAPETGPAAPPTCPRSSDRVHLRAGGRGAPADEGAPRSDPAVPLADDGAAAADPASPAPAPADGRRPARRRRTPRPTRSSRPPPTPSARRGGGSRRGRESPAKPRAGRPPRPGVAGGRPRRASARAATPAVAGHRRRAFRRSAVQRKGVDL